MVKIQCPQCGRSFIWTDRMPIRGRCPTDDCRWTYDVGEQIKKSAEAKTAPPERELRCPNCGAPIASHLTVCRSCDGVVVGGKALRKSNIFFGVVVILILLSLLYRYY